MHLKPPILLRSQISCVWTPLTSNRTDLTCRSRRSCLSGLQQSSSLHTLLCCHGFNPHTGLATQSAARYSRYRRRQSLCASAIDLSAAFDVMYHHILLQRLERCYGSSGSVCQWFQSYLVGHHQFVRTGSSPSSPALTLCGVPQGSVLGPILFLSYIADMLLLIRAMMYALICMLTTPKSMGSVVRLQCWSFRTASLHAVMMWSGGCAPTGSS